MKEEFVLEGNWETREVFLNQKLITPEYSQRLINHSPDGFCWGYNGSGPAQLALAILLHLFDESVAKKHYQTFKFAFVSKLPQMYNFKAFATVSINHKLSMVIKKIKCLT